MDAHGRRVSGSCHGGMYVEQATVERGCTRGQAVDERVHAGCAAVTGVSRDATFQRGCASDARDAGSVCRRAERRGWLPA